MIQGSEEWIAARLGKVTASRISDVTAKTKSGGVSETRNNYMADLISERLTGKQAEHYVSGAMQNGTDTEAEARAAYQFERGVLVKQQGFIDHPRIAMAGASPDGFVGDDGGIEAKCPITKTHINYLLGGSIPGGYVGQMQFQMAVTGRAWVDWCSYDNRLPENYRLHIRRVHRDDKHIAELEAAVRVFLDETRMKLVELTGRYGAPVREAA